MSPSIALFLLLGFPWSTSFFALPGIGMLVSVVAPLINALVWRWPGRMLRLRDDAGVPHN